MSKENSAGLGINNFYGTRTTTEGQGGVVKTEGVKNEFILEITGEQFTSGVNTYVEGTLPLGAVPVAYHLSVTEAFVLSGGVLSVGTSGSEAANGLVLSEANLEAVSYSTSDTFTGTWDDKLQDTTSVGVALSAGTIGSEGKLKLVIEYLKF